MKKLNPLVSVPLKYGLAGALLAMMLLTILYFANRHPLLIPIIYDYRILLFAILIFFSLKEYREFYNGGILHFWQAMVVAIICYMTVAVAAGLFILVLGAIEPNFVTSYVNIAIRDLQENKEQFIESISEKVYQDALENLPSTTIIDLALDYVLKSMPIGLFLTIIISVILRRQPKP